MVHFIKDRCSHATVGKKALERTKSVYIQTHSGHRIMFLYKLKKPLDYILNIIMRPDCNFDPLWPFPSLPPISFLYLGHFPNGHDAVQCFLQSLIILLLCSSVEPNIHCMQLEREQHTDM